MNKIQRLAISTFMVAITFMGALNNAYAQDGTATVPEIKWDTTLTLFQFDSDKFVGQRFSAKCPPLNIRDERQLVHGTTVYTSKSPICFAALHAGQIDDTGGMITLQLNPGQASYQGSTSNGITSEGLPGTQRSMVFIGDTTPPTSLDIHRKYAPRIDWNTKFTRSGFAYERMIGQQFTFECPAAPSNVRSRGFSGTDVYEYGSLICFAAAHAGQVDMDGGYVTLRLGEGNKKLIGSIRHGIESRDGASGRGSITFVDSAI